MSLLDRFNCTSHLVGAMMALAGAAVLVVNAAGEGDAVKLFSFSVYGSCLFFLYLISTLYHRPDGRKKALLRLLDHQAIYLLIAGTYTPLTLVTLRDSLGIDMFVAVWAMALFGIILDLVYKSKKRIIPVIIYLIMGWMALFALDALLEIMPAAGVFWLVMGGAFYTLGVGLFILNHWYPWAHALWHLLVLAGSISHYFTILLYV